MTRNALIKRLEEPFDLVVFGAGVIGPGIAVDAASRGLRTLLLAEEVFSLEDPELEQKSSDELELLATNAPHLVDDDGELDVERLPICLAKTASDFAAVVLDQITFVQLIESTEGLIGVEIEDAKTGQRYQVHCDCIIDSVDSGRERIIEEDTGLIRVCCSNWMRYRDLAEEVVNFCDLTSTASITHDLKLHGYHQH